MQEFQPDDTINSRYTVTRKLGAGAMGSVYLCEDSVENCAKVALKVLISENLDDQDVWAKGEYEALTRLRHPNLAKVYNFGRIGVSDDYFIVSEFIKGVDLYSATEYVNYEELTDIIVQICRALEYIHSQGYVHFDIKPDNILVTRYKTIGIKEGSKVQYDVDQSEHPSVYAKPNVKVIDFGLAEKITGSFSFAIKGTLNYLAPEILNGQTPDKRADLYSLGVTLYQVANRKLPFAQNFSLFGGDDPGPEATRSDLFEMHMKKHPEFLQKIILKLIEERPEDRFSSAREVIQFINKNSDYKFELETAETRASYFYSARMIGRKRESNMLREYYERMFLPPRRATSPQEGAPSAGDDVSEDSGSRMDSPEATSPECSPLVFVTGEMGSGKSRLLEEFQHVLRMNDVPIFVGNCYEGNTKAYQPLVEILRQVVFRLGLSSDFYKKYQQEISRLLPDLRPKEDSKGKGVNFRPDKEKIYFIERMSQVLADAAMHLPYVLVINNIHWVDETSIDVLEKLLERIVEGRESGEDLKLLVVGSLRPEEPCPASLTRLLESLREQGRCEDIYVKRLRQNQIQEFLCSMLSFSEVPPDFVGKLEETTGGNPLFIVETLKALEDDGVIRRARDGWVIKTTRFEHINMPRNMEDLLAKRLEKVESPKRELLEALSVLGKPVSGKFVQKLESFASIGVLGYLRELEQTGLVGKVFEDGKLNFGITQPKVCEILYSHVDEEQRKRYHGDIATALQEAFRGREEQVLEDLAYHCQRSGEKAKAIEMTIRAGAWLRGIFANERAFDCYAYVLEQVETDPAQSALWADTQQELGDLCVIMGRYDVAERSYSALLGGDSNLTLTPERLVRIHLSRGKVFEIQGDYDTALRCYKDARNYIASLEGVDLAAERVRIFNSIGWVYVCMGKYEKAMTISLEALRVIEGGPERMEHAIVYNTIGSANYYKGNVQDAIKYHRHSLQIREHLENIPEITTSLTNLANAYMACRDYGEASEHLRRAMANSEAIGDPYGKAVTLNGFARLHLAVGQHAKASETVEESLRLSKAYSMKYLNTQNYIVRGKVQKRQGEYSKAEGNLFRALSAYTKQGNRWGLCTVLLELAELHRLSGNLAEARQSLKEASSYAEGLDIQHLIAACLIEEARMLCGEDDGEISSEKPLELLDQARRIAGKTEDPELRGEIAHQTAETLVQMRRLADAKAFYQVADNKLREILDSLPEEFRSTYTPRFGRGPRKAEPAAIEPDEEVMSTKGETPAPPQLSTAEDSLRRVSELMGLLHSGESLGTFHDLLLKEVLAVSRADLACWLTVQGNNVELQASVMRDELPLGQAESFLCLEKIEGVLANKKPLMISEPMSDKEIVAALGERAGRISSMGLFPCMIAPTLHGVLYLINPALARRAGGTSELLLLQPFLNLLQLAHLQLCTSTESA